MKDRFGEVYPLAINKDYATVFAVPKEIIDKDGTTKKLAQILNLDEELIMKRISKENDPYEPIKAKISDEELTAIKKEPITGVYLSSEERRFYPYGNIASILIGFVTSPNNEYIGQYGLEKFYNEKLAGKVGSIVAEKGIGGAIIFTGNRDYEPAVDGTDLILTIDPNIQFKVEDILKNAVEKWQAQKGTIIVANPKTGAIMAMASWPAFDPNEYSKVENIEFFINGAIQGIYEPGSVMKPITMAIGIDQGVISPDTKYIDEGVVRIGGYKIMNFDNEAHGEKTMRQALELSLNTGAVFVQKKISKPIFKEYFEKFGFAVKTGVDLPGEVSGNISNLKNNRDIDYATASFGQGIAITPIQLVSAISVLANQGKLMKPYIVEEFKDQNGGTMKTEPKEIGQVISTATATKVSSMLADVVKNGFDKKAGIEGYAIAGKTGTAQIADGKGGYSADYNHTMVGYAPAFDARFVVMIRLEKPIGNRFASNTLTPYFKELINYLLNYYEIPPDRGISL